MWCPIDKDGRTGALSLRFLIFGEGWADFYGQPGVNVTRHHYEKRSAEVKHHVEMAQQGAVL